MLKTALAYRQTGTCPAVSTMQRLSAGSELKYELVRPLSKEMRIVTDLPRNLK